MCEETDNTLVHVLTDVSGAGREPGQPGNGDDPVQPRHLRQGQSAVDEMCGQVPLRRLLRHQ